MSAVRGLAVALAAVTALSLAACSGAAEPDPTPTSSSTPLPSSSSPDPVSLDVHVYGDASTIRTYRTIADAYTSEHPEVTLDLTSDPDPVTAAQTVTSGLDAGTGPDVFLLDQYELPDLVASGRLQPVDTLLEDRGLQFGDDYQRVALTTFSANSGLQCMPAEMSPLVVYYNKSLVQQANTSDVSVVLPDGSSGWTWESFATLARAVADLDGVGPIKGAYIPPDLESVTAFIRSAGGDVVDDPLDPTSLTLAGDTALETLTTMMTLLRDSTLSPAQADLPPGGAAEQFAEGDLGMFVGTRADLPRLRDTPGLRFDTAVLPSFGRTESVSRINGWCINKASDQVGAAADFISFAVGATGARIMAESGAMVPSSLQALSSEAFTQPGRQPRNAEAYANAVRRSDPMPFSSAWLAVAEEANRRFRPLFVRSDLDLDTVLVRRMTKLDESSTEIFTGEGTTPAP